MKQPITLLFVMKAGLLVSHAQVGTWQRVALADSVTAEFPAAPQKNVQNGATAYGLYTDSTLYSVAILRNPQSESIAEENKDEFYGGIIKGAAERANAAEISAKKKFIVNGFEGLEAQFQPLHYKLRTPTTLRVVLVNGTVFTQFFSAAPTAAHLAARQRFFASFTPRQRPAAPVQSRAYRFGQLVGRVAFYGLLLAGILYLVRRPRKNKQSTTSA